MELLSDVTGARTVTTQGTTTVQPIFPAGDPRQDAHARLMALAVGRPLPAEITSQTQDGTSMVRVAETLVQMDLPRDAKVGDRVMLTLLAKEPRLTFLFEREPAALSNVSNTGRLIDTILRAVSQDVSTQVLAGRAPLLATPPGAGAGTGAAALAMQPGSAPALQSVLSNIFSFSGLFYESHLAQWVAGERPRADLMDQPQAKLAVPAKEVLTQDPNQMNRLEMLQERSWVTALLNKLGAKMPAAGQQMPEKSELVIDRDAASMIRMQLDALENRRVIWQGEFWPGQEMEWEVEEDRSQHQNVFGEAAQPSWQSVLRTNLPQLGPVTATVRLTGQTVQVNLAATEETSKSLLRELGPELVTALEVAGARLDFFAVTDESA